jgi:CheY-like chemotaxis protein
MKEISKNNAESGVTTDVDPMHALVVDDEPIMRELLRTMLENVGVSVEIAENGVVAQRKILLATYQLVITDINMPEMDGVTFIRWLKQRKPDVEIVVMTGYDLTEEKLKNMGVTAMEYIVKPPDHVQVRNIVRICREKNRLRGFA